MNSHNPLSLETLPSKMSLQQASYTDLNQLNRIKQLGVKDQAAALKQVSKQFESILVNIMLKTMRESNAAFASGNLLNSSEMDFYEQMLDNEIALQVSQDRGIGLAQGFYQQMQRQFDIQEESGGSGRMSNAPSTDTNANNGFGFEQALLRSNTTPVNQINPVAARKLSGEPELNRENFVEHLLPRIQQAAEKLGVDPKVLLAQSALETGWGQYMLKDGHGGSSHNLFNIKADRSWSGAKMGKTTMEFRDGIMQRESAFFRRYGSYTDSIADYVNLIGGHDRYKAALDKAGDPHAYLRALQDAGYATDPEYAAKVMQIYVSDVINGSRGYSHYVSNAKETGYESFR